LPTNIRQVTRIEKLNKDGILKDGKLKTLGYIKSSCTEKFEERSISSQIQNVFLHVKTIM